MTEKEKLKEIIDTELGFHDYYKVVVTEKDIDRLADKLIENGIRDITEKGVVAVEGEVSIVPENFVADVKFALDGNVDELKRRTEVAEKKFDLLYAEASNSIILLTKEKYKQQAEREIEEEKK